MRFLSRWSRITILAFAAMMLFGSTSAAAQEESAGEWRHYFELYGWLPDLNITTADGTEVTFTLSDLLRNLDMMAMFDFGSRKDKWSMAADVLYMNLGAEQTISGSILNRPVEVDANIDMRAFISTINAGYQVSSTDTNRVDIIGGVRYIYVRMPVDVVLTDNLTKSARPSGHSWNGIVGLEGVKTINDKWYFDYYGDIGTGQADLTWQTKVGFGYKFNKFTGTFGFRYLRWDFSDGDAFRDMDIIGPYLGAKWTW
jgi:hypothetical protein